MIRCTIWVFEKVGFVLKILGYAYIYSTYAERKFGRHAHFTNAHYASVVCLCITITCGHTVAFKIFLGTTMYLKSNCRKIVERISTGVHANPLMERKVAPNGPVLDHVTAAKRPTNLRQQVPESWNQKRPGYLASLCILNFTISH